MSFSIHVDLVVTLHTAVKTAIDAGGATGKVVIRSAADVTLATIPLDYPCGSISLTTGRLTIRGGVDQNPVGNGTAAYGVLCDSTGKELIKLPAVAGTSGVDDCLVLDRLSVVAGVPLELVSCTIG